MKPAALLPTHDTARGGRRLSMNGRVADGRERAGAMHTPLFRLALSWILFWKWGQGVERAGEVLSEGRPEERRRERGAKRADLVSARACKSFVGCLLLSCCCVWLPSSSGRAKICRGASVCACACVQRKASTKGCARARCVQIRARPGRAHTSKTQKLTALCVVFLE